MNYKELPWDSDFFNKKVARLDISADDNVDEISKLLSVNQFQVVYIFSENTTPEQNALFSTLGAKCYDHKVTFRKKLSPTEPMMVDRVVFFDKITPALEDLIVSSGHMSRYYLDTGFRDFQPELYKKWLKKCYQNPDGRIAGFIVNNAPVAAAAFSVTDDTGKMELIAVSSEFRKNGLAKKLMMEAERFYLRNGASAAEVVTQLDNTAACRLYERCGYTINSTVDVWHWWK